jgi:MFS family permease
LWGGVVADRRDRRRIMAITQSSMLVAASILAWLTWTGGETLAALYAVTALTSAAGSFDNPARQALIPKLVPRAELPAALSMNLTIFHAAMIGGPALAGLMIAMSDGGTKGLAWIYAINAASFAGVIVAIVGMRTSGKPEGEPGSFEPPLVALRQGLRFVFGTPIMVWTMAVDFVATFFSAATSLLPIFADQILKVGPVGFGWLRAAPGLGALVGSLIASVRPLPKRQGPWFLGAVAAFGAATIVYGLSRSFVLTFLALFASGFADLISTVIRQTIRQMITPDELRGRMTSVNMIFFMGGPQLGEMESGFVASLFATVALGATVSVVSGGVLTVLFTAWVAWRAPAVRRYALDG